MGLLGSLAFFSGMGFCVPLLMIVTYRYESRNSHKIVAEWIGLQCIAGAIVIAMVPVIFFTMSSQSFWFWLPMYILLCILNFVSLICYLVHNNR